jgi:predicted transcriptional regulator
MEGMNWVQTIETIQRAGLSQSEIARRCGCAQPTINDLATGKTKDPRDSIGQALRDLLEECQRPAKRKAKAS